jgi:hypothetical protein
MAAAFNYEALMEEKGWERQQYKVSIADHAYVISSYFLLSIILSTNQFGLILIRALKRG